MMERLNHERVLNFYVCANSGAYIDFVTIALYKFTFTITITIDSYEPVNCCTGICIMHAVRVLVSGSTLSHILSCVYMFSRFNWRYS